MLHFLWVLITTLVVWVCKGLLCFLVLAILAGPILRRFGYGVARPANDGAEGAKPSPVKRLKPDSPPSPPRPQPGLTLEPWDPVGPLKSDPPEDEVLRSSEIGMGGPTEDIWMLHDGAIFEDISLGWYELGQGRYRAAEADVRGHRRWVLYDSQGHIVYEIDSPNAMEHIRRLRLADQDAAQRNVPNLELQALLQGRQGKALDSFHGLWLDQKLLPRQRSATLRSDALKRYQLTAHSRLPDDLRYTQRLLHLVRFPPYEIHLDGTPTGRFTSSLDAVFSTPDESVLAVKGFIPADSAWHIFKDGRWHAIRGYVTRCYTGGGSYTPYFLTTVTAMEQDRIEFALDVIRIPRGDSPLEVPEWVELPTSYESRAIALRTLENRLPVPLPHMT